MTPNFGQGANSAIEDAATLASLLEKALYINLNGARTQHKLSSLDIDALLQHYRKLRYTRVKAIYHQSRFLARLHARDGFSELS
jgi:2-polyprenyl-6-methoxyphenol hydroxylase and related FAD-dependent oxidoreductases